MFVYLLQIIYVLISVKGQSKVLSVEITIPKSLPIPRLERRNLDLLYRNWN
jgi:hypothetical protein